MSEQRRKQLEAMRARVRKKSNNRVQDPHEFRAPNMGGQEGEKLFYFYVLPPKEEDGIFFYPNGAHWINKRSHECPRLHDGEECALCTLMFDLMEGAENKQEKSEIGKKYGAKQKYAINIYFTDDKENGEYANKVMWYNAPWQVYQKFESCLEKDGPGNKHDPQAWGDFYNPEEAYLFRLSVQNKGGYSNYESSQFIPSSRGPIPNADDIINSLHNLSSKFEERDPEGIQKIVDKLLDNDSNYESESEPDPKPAPESSKPKKESSKKKSESKVKEKQETKQESKSEPEPQTVPPDDDDEDIEALISEAMKD